MIEIYWGGKIYRFSSLEEAKKAGFDLSSLDGWKEAGK